MKKIRVLLAAAFSVFGMCKKRIDKAAAVDGVSKANWNKDTKIMSVTYDASKVSMDAIQKKIAGVGYDTEKFTADDKAYNQLPDCCQYDRKKTSKKSK